jgi:hypothetical protein
MEKWQQEETAAISELLSDLFKVHDVARGDWVGIALALARAHVPAFSMEKTRPGPKTVWLPVDRAELRVAVDELIAQGRAESVLHACNTLARKKPWIEKLRNRNKNPGEALRQQYKQADGRVVTMVVHAREFNRWATDHPEEAAELERRAAKTASGFMEKFATGK